MTSKVSSKCEDLGNGCESLAESGYCNKENFSEKENSQMEKYCRKTCKLCGINGLNIGIITISINKMIKNIVVSRNGLTFNPI